MQYARQSITHTAILFGFTVTENVPTAQTGTPTTPWYEMPTVPCTQFTLDRDGTTVCDIRVQWDDDDQVKRISMRDGGGSGRVGSPDCDLNKTLMDVIAMAEGMATYFANNPDFDGGA